MSHTPDAAGTSQQASHMPPWLREPQKPSGELGVQRARGFAAAGGILALGAITLLGMLLLLASWFGTEDDGLAYGMIAGLIIMAGSWGVALLLGTAALVGTVAAVRYPTARTTANVVTVVLSAIVAAAVVGLWYSSSRA